MSLVRDERGRQGLVGAVLRRLRSDAPFFLVAIVVFAADQATKIAVRDGLALGESWPNADWWVRIEHVTNSGAAFGMLRGQGAFLTVTAVLAIGAIVFYYAFPPFESGLLRVALGMELGGAAGNLLDRVRFGEVTDFIQFPHYPAFNVADSSITVGLAAIFVFFVFLEGRESPAGGSGGDG